MLPQIDKRKELPNVLNQLNITGHAVEIGVKCGRFAKVITSKWLNYDSYYLVDCWQEQTDYVDIANQSNVIQEKYLKSVKNKFRKNDKIKIVRAFSNEAVKQFEDNFFSFIYIDARHDLAGVTEDLTLWYPKLKVGGLFSGHDYVDGLRTYGQFGVKTAVNNFIKTLPYTPKMNLTKQDYPTWFFIKEK